MMTAEPRCVRSRIVAFVASVVLLACVMLSSQTASS